MRDSLRPVRGTAGGVRTTHGAAIISGCCWAARLSSLTSGVLGSVVRCAATVGEALRALEWTYNLRRGGGIVHVIEMGESACFVFAVAAPDTRDTRQYQMAAVTVAFKILESLCGADWRPLGGAFRVSQPVDLEAVPALLPRTGAIRRRRFADQLRTSMAGAALAPVDDSTRRVVAAELHAMRKRAFTDFPVLVRDVIRMQLSIGPCTIEHVAAALSMNPRRLERQTGPGVARAMSRCGNRSNTRWPFACCARPDLSVQEIADFLCFSSAANFATAFRRWNGVYPERLSPAGALISHRAESPTRPAGPRRAGTAPAGADANWRRRHRGPPAGLWPPGSEPVLERRTVENHRAAVGPVQHTIEIVFVDVDVH